MGENCFGKKAVERDDPDQGEQDPPEFGSQIGEREWSVGAGDEQVDRALIEGAKEGSPAGRLKSVRESRHRVEADEAAQVDAAAGDAPGVAAAEDAGHDPSAEEAQNDAQSVGEAV